MKQKTSMSLLEIGNRVRDGKPFKVLSERERKAVLSAAKFSGKTVITRWHKQDRAFNVLFAQEAKD